ncbi:MAG: amidohydrolase [Chloroflexi bacterium]|nr:amidohydrolase [Chloroflexota bacterium]
MKSGFKIIDSDMHIFEPADLWQRYIAPEFKHAAPVGLAEFRRDMRVRVKSRVMLRSGRVRPQPKPERRYGWRKHQDEAYASSEARHWDPTSQKEAMDKEGLDLAILFPTRGLFVLGVDTPEHEGIDGIEPDFAAAIARAYNDWMRDFVQEYPERFIGAGLLAPHNVEASVKEARRCVKELGFKSLFLAPGTVNRRPWHHPGYDPLWEEIQRLNVPISFHGGGQTYLTPDFSLGIFDKLMLWHTFSQPLGIMTVAVSLCGGGVLERFPKLRVGLLEGNCSWATWLLYRLDEHYEWTGAHEAPELKMKPSEYFLRNCYISVEADEAPAKYYIQQFGDDNLVFSTDYPHGDSKYPKAVESFLGLPFPEKSKRKILWDNCCKLYGLPVHAPAPGAKRAKAKK